MNLGTNKAFASQLVTELSQERASSRLGFRQGRMLGHLVPPPASAQGQRLESSPCSASTCKPDSARGLSGHEKWRARLRSVGVSWRSLSDCHQENSRQEPCLSSTCKRTRQLLAGSAEETAGLDVVAWVGGQKTKSHCERARGTWFPENTEKPGKGDQEERQVFQAP